MDFSAAERVAFSSERIRFKNSIGIQLKVSAGDYRDTHERAIHKFIYKDSRVEGELTHIKCYRGWEVDEWSADTLTHIHGYRSLEHEFISQKGVSG
jgi:hypothetical protein